jgi:MFS family permease
MTAGAETPVDPGKSRIGATVIALGVVSLLMDISSEMVYTQIPIFLTQVLKVPAELIGLIEGVAESTASLLRVVAGWISDRMGRRKPLAVLGYGLGAISKPMIAVSSVWPLVLGARFVDRLGKGLRSAPRDALIAENTAESIRGRAFGLHRSMDTIGAILGPLLGAWILIRIAGSVDHRLRMLFLIAAIPGLLAVLALAALVRERPAEHHAGAAPRLPRLSDLSPAYRRYLLVVFLFNLGNSSDAFLILRATHATAAHPALFKPGEILLLYALFNVTEALFGYMAGGLSDRIGRKPVVCAGYAIFAVVYFGMAVAGSRTAFALLFLLYGGYYTLTGGPQRALAADLADPKQRAAQIGAYYTVVGVALLPASLVAGWLFEIHIWAPFAYGGVMALAAIALLSRLSGPAKA